MTLAQEIVQSFGWWTLPLTAILSDFMLGLETLAAHTEEPFGMDMDEDDLAFEAMCRTIDASISEYRHVCRREFRRLTNCHLTLSAPSPAICELFAPVCALRGHIRCSFRVPNRRLAAATNAYASVSVGQLRR